MTRSPLSSLHTEGGDRERRAARTRQLALAVALAALAGVVACGGSDAATSTDDRPPAAGDGETPVVDWGRPSDSRPIGVIMLLHGGGWQPDRTAYEQERQLAEGIQTRGYATVVVGYGEGAQGFREIESVYSQARRRYPDLPICASGTSAGGHLALMLATRKPDLACVVDVVGPVNLTTLDEQGSTEGAELAVDAFGEDGLARFSPVRYANRIRAKVLMVLAQTDPIIPIEQGAELTQALPTAELFVLPAGTLPWLHGATVAPESVEEAGERQTLFTEQAIRGADQRHNERG